MRMRLRMGLELTAEPATEAPGEVAPAGTPVLPGTEDVADPGDWGGPGMRSELGSTRGLAMEGPGAEGLTGFMG